MTKPTLHTRYIIRDARGTLITGGMQTIDDAIASARRLSFDDTLHVVQVSEEITATYRDGRLVEWEK